MIDVVNLKPRAVAVLVVLRGGPLTSAAIRNRVSDVSTGATLDLLGRLRELNLVARYGRDGAAWGLTHNGLGWLQTHGVDATDEAKREVYAHASAQAVRS